MIENNSIKFFLDTLKSNLWGMNLEDWAVCSIGTGNFNNDWYWHICLKNVQTKEEKTIKIPCYKN